LTNSLVSSILKQWKGGVDVDKQELTALVVELIAFAKKELLPRHKVYIDVVLDPEMNGGVVEVEDNDGCPREFTITINPYMDEEQTALTILHEMVHVKQFARRELRINFIPKRQVLWHGDEVGHLEYAQLPYEIEAYEMEKKLYEAWKG